MKDGQKPFSRVSALVLDLDGTLVDSLAGIASSLGEGFRATGRTMPEGDLRALIGPPIRAIALRLTPSLTDADLARIESAYRASYDSDGWAGYTVFPGVADTLEAFHEAGVSLFLVTNKPLLPTRKILEREGLAPWITEAVSRDSRQPPFLNKTSMIADLLARRGLDPASSWMVGDTAEDGEAAAQNGMPFLYATYGYGCLQQPASPIDHFSDVRKLLLPESAAQLR